MSLLYTLAGFFSTRTLIVLDQGIQRVSCLKVAGEFEAVLAVQEIPEPSQLVKVRSGTSLCRQTGVGAALFSQGG